MNSYNKLASMLSSEFNRYLIEHSEVAVNVPKNALVVFQIDGEPTFNKWSHRMSIRNREKDQKLVYVHVKKWRQKACLEKVDVMVG